MAAISHSTCRQALPTIFISLQINSIQQIKLKMKSLDDGVAYGYDIIEQGPSKVERGFEFDEHRDDTESVDYYLPSSRYKYNKSSSSSPSSSSSWVNIRDVLGFIGFLILLGVNVYNLQLRNTDYNHSASLTTATHHTNEDNNVGVIDVSTSQHKVDDIDQEEHTLLIASFRKRFGDIALNLMYDYCDILSSQQQDVVTIDIGEFADFVHDVIDTIGVIGLYDDIFNVYGFATSMKDKLKREKLSPDHMNIVIEMGHQGPLPRIKGRLCGDSSGDKLDIVFWYKHWVGAVIADKLLTDGSLLRQSDDNIRINSAADYFNVLHELTSKRKYPDLVPYHSTHGFWWHYVANLRGPKHVTRYPVSLYKDLCKPWLLKEQDDYNDFVQNSMYRECRHGIGHAIFYITHMRQIGIDKLNVRKQDLPNSLEFTDEALCEGKRICSTVFDLLDNDDDDVAQLCYKECSGGFHHSFKLFRKNEEDERAEDIFNGEQSC